MRTRIRQELNSGFPDLNALRPAESSKSRLRTSAGARSVAISLLETRRPARPSTRFARHRVERLDEVPR
jgi:hypothetical protein